MTASGAPPGAERRPPDQEGGDPATTLPADIRIGGQTTDGATDASAADLERYVERLEACSRLEMLHSQGVHLFPMRDAGADKSPVKERWRHGVVDFTEAQSDLHKPTEFVRSSPRCGNALDARERAHLNNDLSDECTTLAGIGPHSGRNNTLTQQGPSAPVACGTLTDLNDYMLAGSPE